MLYDVSVTSQYEEKPPNFDLGIFPQAKNFPVVTAPLFQPPQAKMRLLRLWSLDTCGQVPRLSLCSAYTKALELCYRILCAGVAEF